MKVAIPFEGGGDGGVSGSRNLGGSSTSFKLSTTKDRYICSFPIPSPSFWIHPRELEG